MAARRDFPLKAKGAWLTGCASALALMGAIAPAGTAALADSLTPQVFTYPG